MEDAAAFRAIAHTINNASPNKVRAKGQREREERKRGKETTSREGKRREERRGGCTVFVRLSSAVSFSLLPPPSAHAAQIEVEESLLTAFAYTCGGALAALTASLGGWIAQEAIKLLTSKFTPLTQMVWRPHSCSWGRSFPMKSRS